MVVLLCCWTREVTTGEDENVRLELDQLAVGTSDAGQLTILKQTLYLLDINVKQKSISSNKLSGSS
jgi:hypothetical protein